MLQWRADGRGKTPALSRPWRSIHPNHQGVGGPLPRGDSHRRRGIGQNAVIRVVDELAFLALLDLLNEQAKLFLDLIIGLIVEVGDAGLDIENGRDRV